MVGRYSKQRNYNSRLISMHIFSPVIFKMLIVRYFAQLILIISFNISWQSSCIRPALLFYSCSFINWIYCNVIKWSLKDLFIFSIFKTLKISAVNIYINLGEFFVRYQQDNYLAVGFLDLRDCAAEVLINSTSFYKCVKLTINSYHQRMLHDVIKLEELCLL